MRRHADAAVIAALSTIALLLSGCGGDSSTNPLTGFDPALTVQTVIALTSIAPDSDALASLELASTQITASVSPTVRPLKEERLGLFGIAVLPMLRRAAALAPAATVVPSSLLGKTLVYDPSITQYKVDDTATGAPADGVRIVYYSIEPFGGPTLPLDSLGYIDVTEQSTASTLAVRVQVVQTSTGTAVTISDYVMGHSATATQTVDHVTLQGFLSDGSNQTDVDLSEDFAEAGSDQLATYQTSVSDGATGESVEFVERDSITATGSTRVTLQLTVDGDEGTMVLDVVGTPSGSAFRLDGNITFDGTEVATIGGSTPSPSFANPDGSALSSSDQSRLRNIWVAVGVVFEYGFALVSQLFLIAP